MSNDPRPRRERRADPARWYKIEAAEAKVVGELVNLPDGVCVHGNIDEIVVITFPHDLSPEEVMSLMKGARAVVQNAGLDKNIIMVPDNVGFLKLRPLSKDETADIEKRVQKKTVFH